MLSPCVCVCSLYTHTSEVSEARLSAGASWRGRVGTPLDGGGGL